jgi:hypothetical protein
MNITFEDKAILWAERYGIIDYRIKGHYMVYNKSYPATMCEPHYTIQHTVDLVTMQELPTKKLKRFDRNGYNNT